MIEDYSRDLLRTGIIELKGGNRETARRYIDRALYMTGDHDVMAEGWYWMSQLTVDPAEKRQALENCLSHDLRHARARRALAILDGKLKPGDIIDPDAPAPAPETGSVVDAQRFMCPKCGARMHFAADGQSLVCDYCTRHLSLQSGERMTGEKDFLLAMATARGHGKPLAEQVFTCQGCGAQFFLPPAQLSVTCPYCGSPHVVSLEKSARLLAPDAILPHAFDQARAGAILRGWLAQKLPAGSLSSGDAPAPHGLYVPVWIFDLGGEILYTGEVPEQHSIDHLGQSGVQRSQVSDRYPVLLRSLPVPAGRQLSAPFVHLLPTYELASLQPYDPRYLADWPAELYDISLGDASLDARSQGYAILKRDMADRLLPVRVLSASSAGLVIDAFRLALLPVWMSEIIVAGTPRLVVINGQTGDVYGDVQSKPSHSGNILSRLADLIGQ